MASAAVAIPKRRDWLTAPVSQLVSHGDCCVRARAWLLARSRTADFAVTDRLTLTGPRWLAETYAWGPTKWPIAWCEAVHATTIDCGVFGAFAREVFREKGIRAYGGQVVRQYNRASLDHYRQTWSRLPGAFDWIAEDEVYHEVCIIHGADDTARVYDPTEGIWLDSRINEGHGGHSAIRANVPRALRWGRHTIGLGQWTSLVD